MKNIKRKKDIEAKEVVKYSTMSFAFLILVLSFVTIGFALYSQKLFINGNVTFGLQGKLEITDVLIIDSLNVRSDSIPAYTDESINFNLTFEKQNPDSENSYMAKYKITLVNNSFYDYECDFRGYTPIIRNSSGVEVNPEFLTYTIDGLDVGEVIKPGETKEVILTINFNPDEEDIYTVDGNITPEVVEKPIGTILASVPNNLRGDLTSSSGNTYISTNISIISSFQNDKEAKVTINNSNFEIVGNDGNPINNYLIKGGVTEDIPVRIKLKPEAKFAVDSVTTGIILTYTNGISVDCGNITINVDIDESFIDKTPPVISNVNASIENATSEDTTNTKVGSIRVSWSVDDEDIDHYTIVAYKVNNENETKLGEYTTTSKYYVLDGLEDGDYYFKVYGTDASKNKNTASNSDIENCSTEAGYCSKSVTSSYDWHYTVTTNLTYVTESNKNKNVNRGYNFTTTVTPNAATTGCGAVTYYLPDTITVRMGGTNISTGTSNGSYQYTGSANAQSGNITVYGVTGDLNITVTGTRS